MHDRHEKIPVLDLVIIAIETTITDIIITLQFSLLELYRYPAKNKVNIIPHTLGWLKTPWKPIPFLKYPIGEFTRIKLVNIIIPSGTMTLLIIP